MSGILKHLIVLKKWCDDRTAADLDELVRFTSSLAFFARSLEIGSDAHRAACSKLKCVTVNSGDRVISEGSTRNDLYVVMRGCVREETVEGSVVRSFVQGDAFDEELIIFNRAAPHPFVAENRSELLILQAEDYRACLPFFLDSFYYKISFFFRLYPFSMLSEAQMKALSSGSTLVSHGKASVIIKEMDSSDRMFILVSGCVRFLKAILDKRRQGKIPVFLELRRLNKPGYFGEMSVLTGDHRFASALSVCDTTVIEIPRDVFFENVSEEVVREFHRVAEWYPSMDEILEQYNELRKWDDFKFEAAQRESGAPAHKTGRKGRRPAHP